MYISNLALEFIANRLNARYQRLGRRQVVGAVGDHISTRVLLHGFYEQEQLASIGALCRANGRQRGFLDIGANIGNHSVYFGQQFKRLLCVEADPDIFEILKINLAQNGLQHATPVNVALSNRPGELTFSVAAAGNLGTGRVQAGASADAGVRTLVCEKGDDLVRKLAVDDVDFIKIDVEGHELEVLQGLEETLVAQHPWVAFESNDVPSFERVSQQLKSLGYVNFYALQFPFSSLPRWARVPLRVLLNAKRSWRRLDRVDRSCIADLVISSQAEINLSGEARR